MELQGTDQTAPNLASEGIVVAPLASAAALDGSVFARVNAAEGIPASWEERARKAWEYYLEEPLVKNCVNSWRTFAVGDEIKIACDDEAVKWEAVAAAERLDATAFVKDMILQLLVKGDAVGFKRYSKDGKDIAEVICVNPVSVRVKYAVGSLVEAKQFPDDAHGTGEGIALPVEQVLHLKWDAARLSPRRTNGEERMSSCSECPFGLRHSVFVLRAQRAMVMPDQKMLEQVRDMVNRMDLKSGLVVPFYLSVWTCGTEGHEQRPRGGPARWCRDVRLAESSGSRS